MEDFEHVTYIFTRGKMIGLPVEGLAWPSQAKSLGLKYSAAAVQILVFFGIEGQSRWANLAYEAVKRLPYLPRA